jgi:hypothetical protein
VEVLVKQTVKLIHNILVQVIHHQQVHLKVKTVVVQHFLYLALVQVPLEVAVAVVLAKLVKMVFVRVKVALVVLVK